MSNKSKTIPTITRESKCFTTLKTILMTKNTSGKNIYNEDELFKFLVSFKTPKDLYGITGVAKNLVPILDELKIIMQKEDILLMTKWLSICEDIVSCKNTISRKVPSSIVHGNKNQLYRECTNNPIYSCLWQRAFYTSLQNKYSVLQSYVVWAFVRLKLNNVDRAIKYTWCLNVRTLSERKYKKIISGLPEKLLSLTEYEVKLEEIKKSFVLMSEKLDRIDDVIDMIERTRIKVLDKKQDNSDISSKKNTIKNRKTTTNKKARGEMPQPEYLGGYVFDKGETVKGVEVKNTSNVNSIDKRKNNKSGLPKADFIGKYDQIKISSEQASTGCYTLKDYALLRKDVVRVINMRNQHLVTQWDGMSLREFVDISSELFNAEFNKSTFKNNEVCVALALILWTGRTWKQLKKIKINLNSEKNMAVGDAPVFLSQEKTLLLPVCGDLPTPSLKDEAKACARSKEENITILLPESLSLLIDNLISMQDVKETLFSKDIKPNHITKYIQEFNNIRGFNITMGKARNFLKSFISRKDKGFRIEAAILTDNISPDDINPMHYSWFEKEKLTDLYATTVKTLMSNISNSSDINKLADDSCKNIGVGSSITPTCEAVEDLVKALKKSIADTRTTDLSERIISFHNQYALYTALMLAYSTGSRATKYPFWLPTDIDISTGFGVISDKDSNDYYNSRLVWFPNVCVQQLNHYNTYINLLMNRLPIIAPDLFEKLTGQLNDDSVLRSRTSQINRQEDNVPYIFFMREENHRKNNSWVESNAEELYKRISGQLPLPLNANRHYLRTRLKEDGCPEEIVNAFMGHWHDGQEPFGKYSSLSPITYKNVLECHLPEILKVDGWESIEGGIL